MKIERDKVYLTRCGEKVRVICVDRNSPWPIVGLDESQSPATYTRGGRYNGPSAESQNDLVSEYVEPPKPREVWVYVGDGDQYGCAYSTPTRDTEHARRLVKFREVIEA